MLLSSFFPLLGQIYHIYLFCFKQMFDLQTRYKVQNNIEFHKEILFSRKLKKFEIFNIANGKNRTIIIVAIKSNGVRCPQYAPKWQHKNMNFHKIEKNLSHPHSRIFSRHPPVVLSGVLYRHFFSEMNTSEVLPEKKTVFSLDNSPGIPSGNPSQVPIKKSPKSLAWSPPKSPPGNLQGFLLGILH